jgi:hypothetical protein
MMSIDEALGWLRSLGKKFLGDGICKSVRASDLLEAIERDRMDLLAAQAIEVEKMLCDAMGRSWTVTGISVHSLIQEVKETYENIADAAQERRFNDA